MLARLREQLPEPMRHGGDAPMTLTCDSSDVLERILVCSDAVAPMHPFPLVEDDAAAADLEDRVLRRHTVAPHS